VVSAAARKRAELSREAQQQANRYLEYRYSDDGSIVLEARLPAESGTLLLKALEVALPEVPHPSLHHQSAATSQLKHRYPGFPSPMVRNTGRSGPQAHGRWWHDYSSSSEQLVPIDMLP